MAALLLIPASAFAGTREELAPFTPWHVDWTERTCAMRRGFGDKADPVILQFERFAPGDRFQLLVTGQRLRSLDPGDDLALSYGSQPPQRAAAFQTGKTSAGIPTLFLPGSSLAMKNMGGRQDWRAIPTGPQVTPEMEAAVTSINLAWGDKGLVLKTGALDKAFAALRTCTDDLLKLWGLDPTV